jgi:hypothetical protein
VTRRIECDERLTRGIDNEHPLMDHATKARLLEAVELALAGDWQAAHVIAQDHEGERLANWIHAVVHELNAA